MNDAAQPGPDTYGAAGDAGAYDPEADRRLILGNLASIDERVATAAELVGRQRSDVRVLLATKTVPVERIRVAIDAGWTLIGENRVQEVTSKADGLADLAHETHFIGHLQRNKINQVLPHVDLVQSVDRMDLAEALDKRASGELDVFVQVNTSAEESKYGASPQDAVELAAQVESLPNVHVRGFMTIALFSDEEIPVRRCYEMLRSIRDRAVASGVTRATELSMGMSGDFEWAIGEGATMVRIGSSVFGVRPTSDSFYWPG